MSPWLCVLLAVPTFGLLYEQNCASRGICGVPLDLRPPELHAVAPDDPVGHLKPLGHAAFDSSWDGEVDEFDENISPELFWTKYYPHRPFVLRGVGKKHPAYTKWKSDEYLSENFGGMKVKTENKNEDRLTDYCGERKNGKQVVCPKSVLPYVESYMNISNFLSKYKSPKHDTYAISQLPRGMAADVYVSSAWNCAKRTDLELKHAEKLKEAPWKTQLYETNLWINYNEGRNFSSSVIHYDMNHQMMCLYDGEKEWIFWDLRTEISKIPMWSGHYHGGQPRGSDDSPIDGERVDLKEFPQFAGARWTNTTLRAGDCLYTPAHILHYVRSTGRNIAGMYMFQTEEKYSPEQCKHPDAQTGTDRLDNYDVMWEFPGLVKGGAGWNAVKMGYPNWKRNLRTPLLKMARASDEHEDGVIRKQDLVRWSKRQSADLVQDLEAVLSSLNIKGNEVPVKHIVSSPVFDEFFRACAIAEEGERNDQELDTRVLRYDMLGKHTVTQPIKHDEM